MVLYLLLPVFIFTTLNLVLAANFSSKDFILLIKIFCSTWSSLFQCPPILWVKEKLEPWPWHLSCNHFLTWQTGLPFQNPSHWLGGVMKRLPALQSHLLLLPELCNPSWYLSECIWCQHYMELNLTVWRNSNICQDSLIYQMSNLVSFTGLFEKTQKSVERLWNHVDCH